MRCTKQSFAKTKERKNACDLYGVHKIIDDLDSGKVEAPDKGDDRAKRGGPAERGKYTEYSAQCNAQSELLWRHSLLEKIEQRLYQPAIKETVPHAATNHLRKDFCNYG